MRWDSLRLTDEGVPPTAGPVPLLPRGAVTRTFDTPEFRGITFHEVTARSALNKVPEASAVPFRWTINPYRGCSHACVYCLAGETLVLMADGRTKPIADIRSGDLVYGTVRSTNGRRYVVTQVLAQWRSVRRAYRVTLADGTSIVASGDHRFLTDRGWKHVAPGSCASSEQRPHLTTNNSLKGLGRLCAPPKVDDAYRRGYLTGMIRGDAHLGSYRYRRRGGGETQIYRFRLALADQEALERAKTYLDLAGVPSREFSFTAGGGPRAPMQAIRNSTHAAFDRISNLIRWPVEPTDQWRRGFLAGIFDAEGSHSGGILRICNADPQILAWICSSMTALDVPHVLEPARPNGCRTVRVSGGVSERTRFLQMTDPAITRKRSLEGFAVKTRSPLRVVAVDDLSIEVPMYDLTTGTGDFLADGVVSHNCFARKTHEYLDLDSGHDFDSQIVVKTNVAEVLRRELSRARWGREHVAMGTNVDCYQRAEGRYRLMPGIIRALHEGATPFSILTKGALILRDLPLLTAASRDVDVSAAVSVGFVDEQVWRTVEPGTPAPRRRLQVAAELNAAGIPCGVLMAPILPFLTDSEEQIDATVAAIAAAGAPYVSPIPLHLRPGAREWWQAWLARKHPALVSRYAALYAGRAYAPKSYTELVTARVRAAAERHGIGRDAARRGRTAKAPAPVPIPDSAPEPTQLSLL